MSEIPLFAEVALTADVPDTGLVRGQVGAVVERLTEKLTRSSSATIMATPMRS